jgi:two-component system, response regulator
VVNHNEVDILLVEDNRRDTELTIRALNKHKISHRFLALEDGVDLLDYLFCEGKYSSRKTLTPPKIILLDVHLPKVSGLEALKKIKEDKRTRMIPVVMITSSRQESDMKTAYEYGANSYIVKPVDFNTFVDVMGHLILYWMLVNQSPKE